MTVAITKIQTMRLMLIKNMLTFYAYSRKMFLNSQISQVEQELEQPEDRFDEKNQELSENNTIEKDSDTPEEYSDEKENFEKIKTIKNKTIFRISKQKKSILWMK